MSPASSAQRTISENYFKGLIPIKGRLIDQHAVTIIFSDLIHSYKG
jgi:hypothetical protein